MRYFLICTLTKYYSANQIEKNVLGRARSPYGVEGVAYRGLVGKPYGKRPLGGHRHRWENNIKVDFRKWDGAWSGLIWLRIATGGGNM
jgi:hypothetical protein